jgi:arylsulfatase A-like enzyme
LIVALWAPSGPLRAAAPPARPNLVLIFADDLGYGDVGPFGSTKNRTPNLDRMAREGMKFTSFYAAPVCTPSRAQVLTGCYAKRVSLPNVIFPAAPVGLSTNEHTVAKLLQGRGYATMCIGKWHVGDAPEFLPPQQGFDHYFGLPYSNDMGGPEEAAVAKKSATARRDRRPPLPLVRDQQVIETLAPRDQDRLTARYTDEALQFIGQNRERPFFLYFPHTAVHVPIHPGDKFQGQSANGQYGDWVEELDWSVGRVLAALRELGLAERTLVIFSSDNGPWLTQGTNGGVAGPLRGGKGGTYEGGVREPTVAWWPGQVPAGKVCDAVAGNIDFLPTFVTLAGGTVPADRTIDGRDISSLLLGRSQTSPHEAWYYFSGNNLQAVRAGPWKLALTRQSENMGKPATHTAGGPFTPKLYNLDAEIGERTDLSAQHPEVVQRLQALAAKMDADLGATNLGPGVRPPGHATKPTGLWLPGHTPRPDTADATAPPAKSLGALQIGDTLAGEDAPRIANRPTSQPLEVVRLPTNPILRPEMLPGRDGENINGPSLIRVPAWLPNPLGKYYLYFAHHGGKYIRLAYADQLEGPWKIYEPGTLRLEEAPGCKGHIASPEAVVDDERKEIRLYFHGPAKTAMGQQTFLARSRDGLHFKATDEGLGIFYWRVFHWGDWWYAMGKGGQLYRSRDGLTKFEAGPNPLPGGGQRDKQANTPGPRHVALQRVGDRLWVYYTNIGDAPERILRCCLGLAGDWQTWQASATEEVLRPETDWEGARLPLKESVAGAMKGRENALRDPAIFVEDGRVYLLYSVAGEAGIAIAELRSDASAAKPAATKP